MIKLSINDRYFFNEHGNAFIPSIQELIEYYKLTELIYVIAKPFPYEEYMVKGYGGSYRTRKEAEIAANKTILSEAENYRKKAKICTAQYNNQRNKTSIRIGISEGNILTYFFLFSKKI